MKTPDIWSQTPLSFHIDPRQSATSLRSSFAPWRPQTRSWAVGRNTGIIDNLWHSLLTAVRKTPRYMQRWGYWIILDWGSEVSVNIMAGQQVTTWVLLPKRCSLGDGRVSLWCHLPSRVKRMQQEEGAGVHRLARSPGLFATCISKAERKLQICLKINANFFILHLHLLPKVLGPVHSTETQFGRILNAFLHAQLWCVLGCFWSIFNAFQWVDSPPVFFLFYFTGFRCVFDAFRCFLVCFFAVPCKQNKKMQRVLQMLTLLECTAMVCTLPLKAS